jgi:hypothetical protein
MADTIDLDETLAQSLEAIAESKGHHIERLDADVCRQAAALLREQAAELDKLTERQP